MKTKQTLTRWLVWCLISAWLPALLVMAGCGTMVDTSGTGGSGTIVAGVGIGGTGTVKTSALGIPSVLNITDNNTGLIGAVVFLDRNNNNLPDPDEPFAFTDQNGRYSLQADAADLAAFPLLLQAIAGATIDTATGQAVAIGFVVMLNSQ
jgi:hypothetical protein